MVTAIIFGILVAALIVAAWLGLPLWLLAVIAVLGFIAMMVPTEDKNS